MLKKSISSGIGGWRVGLSLCSAKCEPRECQGIWQQLTQTRQREDWGPPISSGLCAVCIALLTGVARRWNQTGQKYAGEPDVATALLPRHGTLLWFFIVATYALISRRLGRRAARWIPTKQMSLLPVPVCLAALSFKVAFTAADSPELLDGVTIMKPLVGLTSQYSLVAQARILFLGLVHLLGCAIYYEAPWKERARGKDLLSSIHDVLSLFLLTQSRAANVPLFLVFFLQYYLIRAILDRSTSFGPSHLTITSLLLQYSSFFILGGSNAISSVDLSNAYNGVSGYNIVAVGILTFLGNWAGPAWWTSATLLLVAEAKFEPSKARALFSQFELLTMFTAGSVLAVMLACTSLREHLFIWTVFSPKFLFTIAWTFGHHFVLNGLFGLLLPRFLMET